VSLRVAAIALVSAFLGWGIVYGATALVRTPDPDPVAPITIQSGSVRDRAGDSRSERRRSLSRTRSKQSKRGARPRAQSRKESLAAVKFQPVTPATSQPSSSVGGEHPSAGGRDAGSPQRAPSPPGSPPLPSPPPTADDDSGGGADDDPGDDPGGT
jgi:hypothetical protein